MSKSIRTLIFSGMALVMIIVTGCHEAYERLDFQAAAEMPAPMGPPGPEDHRDAEQVRPGPDTHEGVPASFSLVPAAQREAVFDTLLGPGQEVYFLQEPGRETFAVFDANSTTLSRMAQAGRIGNPKNSVLVVLGMSFAAQDRPRLDVYTFENGYAATMKRYTAGKRDFLGQFRDGYRPRQAGDIQGITGATPVWKPVSEQIRESCQLLLSERDDAAWVAQLKQHGKIWHRGKAVVADADAGPGERPENTLTSAEPAAEIAAPVFPDASSSPSYEWMTDDRQSADFGNDFLSEHAEAVAAVEVTLFVCGLLIIAVMQIIRTVYK